ncbi:MAG: hypothetical protein ACJA08_001211 [Cyclobacteriaceae bacterium]|jgi:uncharacterized protein (DUF2141 family)
MKHLISSIFLIIIAEFIFLQCANPLRPSGGPKDTIPPTLLFSNPQNQTLNFSGQEIKLYFDEYISADKMRQKLIITPNTNTKYKHIVKKRDLILKFDKQFKDSTTFTFNFFDGVVDITEKNPVENLILAISTGAYIDSLRVIGSVRDLFTHKVLAKTTVGLYQLNDTLDILMDAPYYFVTTLENGTYEIRNIKTGKYKIAAFVDENKNLKLDVATEQYAFTNDTIIPNTDPDSTYLQAIKIDASSLRFISARPSGKYFDARYNKTLNKYFVRPLDSTETIYHTLNNEKDAIRFYNHNNSSEQDSVAVILQASDTVDNTTIDTAFVKFKASVRKSVDFNYSLAPKKSSSVELNTIYNLRFNKPILHADTSFISYTLDTLKTIKLKPIDPKWNDNKTQLSFKLDFDKIHYQDTLHKYLSLYAPDTLQIDSVKLGYYNLLNRIPQNKFIIKINNQSFISVESDTSKVLTQLYQFYESENYGTIRLKLTTDKTSYFVQLINSQGNPIKQLFNCAECKFDNINPGDYSFRILIDDNQNGRWEIGNIGKSKEPETIINLSEKSALRANWSLDIDYSF